MLFYFSDFIVRTGMYYVCLKKVTCVLSAFIYVTGAVWDIDVIVVHKTDCGDECEQMSVVVCDHVHQSTPPVRNLLMPAVNVISQSRAAFSSAPASSSCVDSEQQTRSTDRMMLVC